MSVDATKLMHAGMSAAQANAFAEMLDSASSSNKAPTTKDRGGVLQQPAIKDLKEAPTAADFNKLLKALRAAGVLA